MLRQEFDDVKIHSKLFECSPIVYTGEAFNSPWLKTKNGIFPVLRKKLRMSASYNLPANLVIIAPSVVVESNIILSVRGDDGEIGTVNIGEVKECNSCCEEAGFGNLWKQYATKGSILTKYTYKIGNITCSEAPDGGEGTDSKPADFNVKSPGRHNYYFSARDWI